MAALYSAAHHGTGSVSASNMTGMGVGKMHGLPTLAIFCIVSRC